MHGFPPKIHLQNTWRHLRGHAGALVFGVWCVFQTPPPLDCRPNGSGHRGRALSLTNRGHLSSSPSAGCESSCRCFRGRAGVRESGRTCALLPCWPGVYGFGLFGLRSGFWLVTCCATPASCFLSGLGFLACEVQIMIPFS